MQTKQILLINHYAGSVYHGMEYRPYYLAKQWVKLGYKVLIVAAGYSHIRQKNINFNNKQKVIYENIDGIDYLWIKTIEYNKNGIKRMFSILQFLYGILKYKQMIYKLINPDLVIASSTYPLDIYIANNIAKEKQAKLIYEVHDLWPLSPIEVGHMSPYHPFIMMVQMAENFAYRHADKVISLLPDALNHMQQHGLLKDKFYHIPNGIEIINYDRNEINKSATLEQLSIIDNQLDELDSLGKKYDFLIAYAGGMANGNSLTSVIDAIVLLNNMTELSIKNFAFVLIGEGMYKQNLIDYVKSQNISNIYFFKAVPKIAINLFLSKMNLLFVGFIKSPLYRFGVSPNKLFDYMFARKPIVAAISASNDLVSQAQCGITVEADNVDAIASALKQLMILPQEKLEELGDNAYNYVINNHSYSILADKFLQFCYN